LAELSANAWQKEGHIQADVALLASVLVFPSWKGFPTWKIIPSTRTTFPLALLFIFGIPYLKIRANAIGFCTILHSEGLTFMRLGWVFSLCSALVLATAHAASASPHVRRGPTAPHAMRSHAHNAARAAAPRISMDPERATQIQTALVKAGYLTGAPSGVWDAQSQAAMEKLQADNGWQTKLVPDSRALIKLGLGPHPTNIGSTAVGSFEASSTTPEGSSVHSVNQ
jgi:hypothetical protein